MSVVQMTKVTKKNIIKIEVKGYKCERCNHEWIPRKKEYPNLCPNCKSAYWDKPARKKK